MVETGDLYNGIGRFNSLINKDMDPLASPNSGAGPAPEEFSSKNGETGKGSDNNA
jgi:hypothetical protein